MQLCTLKEQNNLPFLKGKKHSFKSAKKKKKEKENPFRAM